MMVAQSVNETGPALRGRAHVKLIIALTASLILLAAFPPGSSSQQEANSIFHPLNAYAAYCWDHGCDYINPSGTCDGDVKPVDGLNAGGDSYPWGEWVQLRYSPSCGANWGRTGTYLCVTYAPDPTNHCYEGVFFQNSYSGGGQSVAPSWDDRTPTTHWTFMMSGASSKDRVCYWHDNGICTPWW
jgi:hypothetical protein